MGRSEQPALSFKTMDALEVLENLEQVNIKQIAVDSFNEVKEIAADLNATQLSQGVRSDGSELLPSYAPLTIELKKQKSGLASVTDHVTLFDTGEFYRELYAEAQGDDIEYGSKNEKAEKLNKKYSTRRGSIFGLDDDTSDDLVEGHLKPTFYDNAHEATGL